MESSAEVRLRLDSLLRGGRIVTQQIAKEHLPEGHALFLCSERGVKSC